MERVVVSGWLKAKSLAKWFRVFLQRNPQRNKSVLPSEPLKSLRAADFGDSPLARRPLILSESWHGQAKLKFRKECDNDIRQIA